MIGAEFLFVLEACCAEIEKESFVDVGSSEVIDKLNFVSCDKILNGLQFQDKLVFDNEISGEFTDNRIFITNFDFLFW